MTAGIGSRPTPTWKWIRKWIDSDAGIQSRAVSMKPPSKKGGGGARENAALERAITRNSPEAGRFGQKILSFIILFLKRHRCWTGSAHALCFLSTLLDREGPLWCSLDNSKHILLGLNNCNSYFSKGNMWMHPEMGRTALIVFVHDLAGKCLVERNNGKN